MKKNNQKEIHPSFSDNQIKIYKPNSSVKVTIPLFNYGIECGFPSPATDYLEEELDLNKYIIQNPSSTFFGRVTGYSMEEEGIMPGDIVVIDRSLANFNNKICLCWYEEGFTLKKVEKINNKIYLVPKNKKFPKIEIKEGSEFNIWGIVTFYIKKLI